MSKAKIIICDRNVPFDNNYLHVFNMKTLQERDNYINSLFNSEEDYKILLNNAKEINTIKTNNINQQIQKQEGWEIFKKNYCVVQSIDGEIEFYFITNITNSGNNNVFILSLTKDVFMSNFDVISKVQNFNLLQGQAQDNAYIGNELSEPIKKLKNVSELRRNNDSGSYFEEQLKDVPFIFLFVNNDIDGNNLLYSKTYKKGDTLIPTRDDAILCTYQIWLAPAFPIKVSKLENPIKISTEAARLNPPDYIDNDDLTTSYKNQPYFGFIISVKKDNQTLTSEFYFPSIGYEVGDKVLIIDNLYFTILTEEKFTFTYESDYYDEIIIRSVWGTDSAPITIDWNSNDLWNYVATSGSQTILDFQAFNYNIMDTKVTDRQPEDVSNIRLVPSSGDVPDHYIVEYLSDDILERCNTFEIDVKEENNNYLKGMNTKEVMIENNIKLDIPDYIRKYGKFTLKMISFPTPNEWETRFYIYDKNGKRIEATHSGITMNNQKELFYAIDALNNYKANNPVMSKFSFFNAFFMSSFFAQNAWFNHNKTKHSTNRNGGLNPLFGGFLVTEIMSNFLAQRLNLRSKPDNISGGGNGYTDLFFNVNAYGLTLFEYEYMSIHNKNANIAFKRYGMEYECNFINSYYAIKRKNFNFFKIDDIYNALFLLECSKEEKDVFNEVFKRGLTIWNDYTKYQNYIEDNPLEVLDERN